MPDIEEKSGFVEFIRNAETRISKLTHLEIKTIVGDYKLGDKDSITPRAEGDFFMIYSKFNLLEGDVTSYISNELVQDRYAWVREFHARKEEKGHEIIQGNIRAIISLFELYNMTKRMNVNEANMDETNDNNILI